MQTSSRVPAFMYVSKILQDRIEEGNYAPGEWLPTERDLATEMNISRPVVRSAIRHLQDKGVITQQGPGHRQQVRIFDKPPLAEVSSAVGRTVVAIMSQSIELASAHSILRGINAELRTRETPYQLAVYDTEPKMLHHTESESEQSWERIYLERINRDGAAGVILYHVSGPHTIPLLRSIQQKGIPLVLIDRYPYELECDFVGVDNYGATKVAVEHLIGLGHQRIGYILQEEQVSSVQERLRGYRDALEICGLSYVAELTVSARPTASLALDQLLSLPKPPTALVAVNDFAAFAIIQEANKRGIHVPKDLSVVGFDNSEAYTPRPGILTTIRQPFEEIGRRAVELVLARQSPPRTPSERAYRHVVLPGTLVVRESTGPAIETAHG